jgi:hypothetical protein
MTYRLSRTRDGAGDSGNMSLAIFKDDTGKVVEEHNARPRVGAVMRVGSLFSRTYSMQDWWQTTKITQILEDTGYFVRFKTGNSEYIWETDVVNKELQQSLSGVDFSKYLPETLPKED